MSSSRLIEFTPKFMFGILSKCKGGEKILSVDKVSVEPAVGENQNFLSEALKLSICYKSHQNKYMKRTVFVKYSEFGKKKNGINIKKMYFDVEAKAYGFLENLYEWTEMNKFNVERYWPEHIYTSIDDNIYLIMLQNLKEAQYEIMKGEGVLDREHIFVAVDRLARCHAMSRIYLVKQKPDITGWPEPRFDFLKTYHKHGLLALAKAVRSYRRNWDYIADYLIDFAECFYDEYLLSYETVKEDFPVLILGDCWANNIMFKYVNGKPIDARFVDFQFSYITSFAWDLQYLLYITLLPRERLSNIDELLQLYQQIFSETIIALDGDLQLAPTLNEVYQIMDKLLLPQFLYSAISVVEIYSVKDEDYDKWESIEIGTHISTSWFLKNPIQNGYIDNIEYFEKKGLFKEKI